MTGSDPTRTNTLGLAVALIGMLLLLQPAAAQPLPQDSLARLNANQLKRFARNAERTGDPYTAIDFYALLLQRKPNRTKDRFALAELYRETRDYPQAEAAYAQCYAKDPDKWVMALFYQALMEKMNGKYARAADHLEQFKTESRGKVKDKTVRKWLKLERLGVALAPQLVDSPMAVIIHHLDTSINKAHVEFSPLPLNDSTLVYASLKANRVEYYASDTNTLPKRQFYRATKANGNWQSEGPWQGPFNDPEQHTGNGAFSPDGQRFYFTRCRPNWQNKTICHIYRSERKNGTWQPPVKLDKSINHPRYTTTHPAVGTEPKKQWEVLYFVSDRPNGKGGLDLWYTVYDPRKKAFRQPRNMGSKINTIRDEVTPYYHNDTRTLYFSSAGHPGMGGLDVFRATGALRKWTPVENLGYPLNSRVDELYYTLSEDRESGFFVSNREGSVALKHATCCDDIFRFELPEYVRIATSGFVHEAGPADSAARVDSTIVHLYLIDPESAEEIFLRSDTADAQGKYFFQLEQGRDYRIATQRSGYYRSEQEVSTRSLIYSDTLHRPIAVRPLDTKPIVLKNIYYEFNKADLTEQATTVLDTSLLMLLQENPELVVEISSHTDSKGTEKYNQYLSQNRAESVVKHLRKRGIARERLRAKGYGESQPIAPNLLPDGRDNPEGRQKNRRTEFRVVGVIAIEEEVIYEE